MFVIADVDVLGSKLVHNERQFLALRLLLRIGFLGSLVRLEGINDELVVGYGVDGVVAVVMQFGAQPLNTCFADADLAVEQRPEVNISLQIVHLEHLALLAVFDTQPVELGIECQQVDAYAVNQDGGLQFVFQDIGSALEQLLLEECRIDDEESYNKQG